DCSAWIPAASAAILARHRPDEFSISFADRMQVLMRSGRFGMRHACREVYAANLALFRRWQATKAGDFAAFLAGAKLYRDGYDVTDVGTRYATTETGCANIDCVDLAELLTARGYNPAILNLASAKRPGGGYDQGFAAQEESLCQMSNLSLSLYQYANPNRIKCVRDSGVPTRCLGYPLDRHFGGIYTPSVTFFRHNRTRYFALRETPFRCDVMTVAALSFNGRTAFSGVEEISFRADDGGFTPEGEAIMLDKIRTIFRMAVEHGKDALVLGAFGCGAYCLPSADVAALFRRVLDEPEFAGKFRLVTFAILEGGRHPRGPEGKFAPFYRIFGTYPVA
ncbi:MAG: TIGR02452 family protein, partial [Clostridia bacterium]|nr:TIGR02452 family protein [Clostridia bacterium]